MKITMRECNQCAKRVEILWPANVGWIQLTFTKFTIIKENGFAGFKGYKDVTEKETDFCSKECLVKFIDSM